MNFKTIHTAYGLTALAAAETTGKALNLTHMAVGDGAGNETSPRELQTQLVREQFRAPVNRVYQNPQDPIRFTAELVIPATEGGFALREVAVFDDQGGMVTVGNLPETYKPTASEGAYADTVVRIEFMVGNAELVTLQIDPHVAVATQTWITNNITAAALLPGGTTGQYLSKKTNASGDTQWVDPDTANITVDVIEERQTLADAQTVVTLAVTTTYGLAVYIDGARLAQGSGPKQWQPDHVNKLKLTLGKSYPAGTEIICTQNEPSGNAPAPIERSKNLSDLDSSLLARNNLNVHSKAESNAAGQPGDLKYTASNTAPTGWMKANGAAISRTAYASLFAVIGTKFGAGDDFNTFNLPDLRGEFIRGWDDGRGVDAERPNGSFQKGSVVSMDPSANAIYVSSLINTDENQALMNTRSGYDSVSQSEYSETNKASIRVSEAGDLTTRGFSIGATRPRNIALLAVIKY